MTRHSDSGQSPVFSRANLDAVIVDLDGTMVDTLGDFVLAINLMLTDIFADAASQAPQLSREVIESMVGKGSENLIHSVLNHVAAQADGGSAAMDSVADARSRPGDGDDKAALFDAAFAAYQKHYLAVNGQQAQVYPGVTEGLQALQASGLKLACLTNKPLGFATTLLKLKGLDGFFSQVFGGDSFDRKKPDPLPLLKTCEALGSQPSRTLMIGDSSNDAQAARAAGCPVVLLTYGYNHGHPVRAVDADGFMDSLQELQLQA